MKTRYQDHTVMVIPITRSVVFWEASEVCRWFEALRFDAQTISDAYAKRISGATLISLVNSDRLGELGISTLKRTQLLWNLERRIKLGDEKAGTAIDPRVFLGVEEHLQELQQPVDAHNQPYSDTPDEYDSSRYSDPSRRGARGGGMAAGGATGLGGGMPTGAGAGENGAGGGGGAGDLLDLMSMDMGVGASGESSERKVEGDAGADESKLLAIEDTPPPYGAGSDDASAAAAGALVLKKKKKKKSSSGGKKTFNLIDLGEEGGGVEGEVGEEEEEDEEEDEGGEEGEEVVYAEGGMGPQALVFEVVFPKGDTPNIMLEESQPGNKLSVKSFPKRSDGSTGTAEAGGRIEKGDYLVAVNSIRLEGFAFNDAIHILTTQGYPLSLKFRRVPRHLRGHNLEGWSVNALRTVLIEEGVELTGLERHAQLVTIARRTFWKKPVPLPPAPPHVAPGTAAMINGETSVCGWLLMKGPHDRESQRLFCDLHGNELLYHKPKGGVTGQTAGYNAAPAGSVDMSKVKLVATTRSSEEGHRDLRMVNQDDQVYLLSFAKDDALTQWMRKLNTAMIIGPGARTSGFREPSAPYMVSKSHRSLTVMWLPPRQPYLNSVHSFQVAYKNGINPLKDWTMATDEAHSTKFNIKGLKEGERYFVKVRAMHELDRGQMVWGDWSEHSRAFVTDKQAYRPTKPARHIWILVHGMRGDVDDMQYMAGCIRSRHGSDAHVVVAECNSAAFKTLDGISKGGTRLYEEAMQTIDSVPTAEYISFIGHGLGGIYARYALRLLNDASVFTDRLSPMNFITLGTPHLGSLMASGGTIGRMVDSETPDQLALKDTDMQRGGGPTRDAYGEGGANSMSRGSNYGVPSSSIRRAGGGTRPPILARMTGEEYLAPLRLFRRRVLYANVKLDTTVEYPSASVRFDDPYVYVPDQDLENMCSPHYDHVMVTSSSGSSEPMNSNVVRGPGGGFPTALAEAAPEPGMWEIMAQVLDSVGWERVDIFNSEGMSPYKDLVVASEWLNSEGTSIVCHLVDNSPNKPLLPTKDEGEEEQGGGGREEEVEDLISGLDDDDSA